MNAADLPAAITPLTEAQWAEILRGRRVRYLFTKADQQAWSAHSRFCLSCKHISDLRGETGRRGFCLEQRIMTSNAFPILCPKYESA